MVKLHVIPSTHLHHHLASRPWLVTRIISGGQTGVDRAALDLALQLGISISGWCPQGRLAEDGPIPFMYPLQETPSPKSAQRTAWNVRDADGTLILAWGTPTDGTALTIRLAKRFQKPYLVLDLLDQLNQESVRKWVREKRIGVLNIAGPPESHQAGTYTKARECLWSIFDGDLSRNST